MGMAPHPMRVVMGMIVAMRVDMHGPIVLGACPEGQPNVEKKPVSEAYGSRTYMREDN
jgi:hypothetical protein